MCVLLLVQRMILYWVPGVHSCGECVGGIEPEEAAEKALLPHIAHRELD